MGAIFIGRALTTCPVDTALIGPYISISLLSSRTLPSVRQAVEFFLLTTRPKAKPMPACHAAQDAAKMHRALSLPNSACESDVLVQGRVNRDLTRNAHARPSPRALLPSLLFRPPRCNGFRGNLRALCG